MLEILQDSVLRLSGHLPRPLALAPAQLQRLPSRTLGPTEVLCFTGRPVAESESLRGVRLLDVLALSGLPELPRPQLKECVIVAHGGDGYRAVFSWNELYNTAVGDGVLVLFERNGQPLGEHLGALALLSSVDLKLGPRHLRQLCRVEVLRLPAG